MLSLCSPRYWAAKAPPFKVELTLNPSQSKAAADTGSSRNATTPFCEVAKFQRNNVSTKKTQRPIYSQNHWQSVHKSRPREDGRGCVVRSLNKRAIQRHRNPGAASGRNTKCDERRDNGKGSDLYKTFTKRYIKSLSPIKRQLLESRAYDYVCGSTSSPQYFC
jgi:hypothetical protein